MNSYTFTFYCNYAFDKSVHIPTYQENFISRGVGTDRVFARIILLIMQ